MKFRANKLIFSIATASLFLLQPGVRAVDNAPTSKRQCELALEAVANAASGSGNATTDTLIFLRAELSQNSAVLLKDPNNSTILKKYSLDSDETKAALNLNIATVNGKLRKDGTPYADHPIRLAMVLHRVIGKSWSRTELQSAMSEALVHDALEEGDGVSVPSIEKMSKTLANSTNVVRAAVILTEPQLDYDSYSQDKSVKQSLEKVGLLLQIKAWMESHPNEAKTTLAAAFADKIVNLFDLGYIANDAKLDESQRKQKLEKYLGSILYAHGHLAALATIVGDKTNGLADLEQTLRTGIDSQIHKYGLDKAAVQKARDDYLGIENSYGARLRNDIARTLEIYHQARSDLNFRVIPPQ